MTEVLTFVGVVAAVAGLPWLFTAALIAMDRKTTVWRELADQGAACWRALERFTATFLPAPKRQLDLREADRRGLAS